MSGCDKYIELISAGIDHELGEAEKAELAAHLETCDECRRVHDAFSCISSSMRNDLAEAPDGLCRNVMSAVGASAAQKHKSRRRQRVTAWLAAAACLVLTAAAGSGLFRASSPMECASCDSSENECAPPEHSESLQGLPAPKPEAYSLGLVGTDGCDESVGSDKFSAADVPNDAGGADISEIIIYPGADFVSSLSENRARECEGPDGSGNAPVPTAAYRDKESIASVMELLAPANSAKSPDVSGSPLFVVMVSGSDGTAYSISVWADGGRLYCRNDSDGNLYTASGNPGSLTLWAGTASPAS